MKNLYTTFLFIKVIAVSNYKLSTFFIIFLIKFAVKLTWQYKTEGSLSKIDQDSFIWPLRRLFKTFIFILWLWLNQKFVCPLFILSTKRTREMFVRAVFHALLMNCSTRWSEGCTYCSCWSEHTNQHQLLSPDISPPYWRCQENKFPYCGIFYKNHFFYLLLERRQDHCATHRTQADQGLQANG